MHILILLLFLLLSGCSNQGLNDAEIPRILGVSIETNYLCKKGGTEVNCLLRNEPSDVITVKVRIQGSDDIGIAGYYITHTDSLIPANWITVAPAGTTYDETVTYGLPSGDGLKKIQVWIKDLGGKFSDVSTAEVLVVSGQVKDWKKETIDEKSDFGNGLFMHALRVDSNGNPDIVFGENELNHAVKDASGWAIEKLDDIDTGGSLTGTVLDSSGNVHLSFIDDNNYLIYATNSSGSWETTTVDDTGHASGIPDIDYGIGGVHISYYDAGSRDLMYVNCVSDCSATLNWKTRGVDSTGDVGNHSSVKAGKDGSVHISYFDYTNNSLKYVTVDSNGLWGAPVTVDDNSGGYSDISLDSNNSPHIAYYDRAGVLRYAANISGNWDTIEVDTDSKTANFLSIAVDAGDNVHISYYDITGLKYATNQTGAWVAVPLDTVGTSGLYNLISSDSNNNIHISYFDSTNTAVKYAVCTGGCTDASNWNIERVLSSGDTGRYNSVAVDTNGNIHAGYLGGGELRYAENTTGTWRTAAAGSSGASGEFTSIAIDSGGNIHVGYYDNDNNGLKYAVCQNNCIKPENWTSTIIEKGLPGNISFSHVSLIVDDDKGIHISYYDISSGSLKYAFCSSDCTLDISSDGIGDNWKRVIVDKGVIDESTQSKNFDFGQYSSITIDKSSKKIYISYFERIRGSLMIAVCGSNCEVDSDVDGIGENWTPETVDEGEIVPISESPDARGLYTSVKADNNGYVHISYFNETSGDLKYATNKNGKWRITVVEEYDRTGLYSSLAIDSNGNVYVVYYRYSAGLSVLKYAVCPFNLNCISDNWDTYILDMFDNPGMFASVALDSDNKMHVIYYNADNGGFNYTYDAK